MIARNSALSRSLSLSVTKTHKDAACQARAAHLSNGRILAILFALLRTLALFGFAFVHGAVAEEGRERKLWSTWRVWLVGCACEIGWCSRSNYYFCPAASLAPLDKSCSKNVVHLQSAAFSAREISAREISSDSSKANLPAGTAVDAIFRCRCLTLQVFWCCREERKECVSVRRPIKTH